LEINGNYNKRRKGKSDEEKRVLDEE